MNLEGIKTTLQLLADLNREDPEATTCLMQWAKVTLSRAAIREKNRRTHRKLPLPPIELRQPSLAEMGINVVGCSACADTPKNKTCPGCGNPGVAPRKKVPRK